MSTWRRQTGRSDVKRNPREVSVYIESICAILYGSVILHREIVLTMKPDFTLRAYLMIKITSIAR